jgi:single-stranded DNA-binding protein
MLNRVILMGRITHDLEVRQTPRTARDRVILSDVLRGDKLPSLSENISVRAE